MTDYADDRLRRCAITEMTDYADVRLRRWPLRHAADTGTTPADETIQTTHCRTQCTELRIQTASSLEVPSRVIGQDQV